MPTVAAPVELVEAVAAFRLPQKADLFLQRLMDRNTEGLLSPAEREQLEAWVAVSEEMAIMRAEALRVLGRKPA